MNSIEFRDLKRQYQALKNDIDTVMMETFNDGQFILGDRLIKLERQLAEFVGVQHCISCANGTDALQLVLMAWGVGPGDAVFTSDFTFFASAGCASILGATPVFVDIDPDTFNMDVSDLERRIDDVISVGELKPKVIIPVDLFGQMADLPAIEKIAKKHHMLVLEDAAQAFGGAIHHRRAGSFGDAATTSFFPAKPLGCYGDGGAIFTDDAGLASDLRSLRSQGRSVEDKYDNRQIGMNSRLDTLQAAILEVKLRAFIDHELSNVNRVAELYTEKLHRHVKTPIILEGYFSSWAQYSIVLASRLIRDTLKAELDQLGIPTMIYYPRGLHQQTAYADLGFTDDMYPNTMFATEHILALPMHPYLTEEEIEYVSSSLIRTLEDIVKR